MSGVSLPVVDQPSPSAGLEHRSGVARLSEAGARPAVEAVAARAGRRVERLYIHVPFCLHKCHYCDFYSFVDRRDRQGVFTERLIAELRTLASAAGPLRSVFVGGGTPTLLAPEHWRRVLVEMSRVFDFADACEFSVECNPETATEELMGVLADGGINRLSVGAQSFDPRHLKTLERWHDPTNVERSLRLAHAAGIVRASLDLIYAIPGQSVADWDRDLEMVAGLAGKGLIDHASCYALTYEPNTAMTKRLERGAFEPADEDDEVAMYRRAVDRLGEIGMLRYEVSNFAVRGAECAHNLGYWRGEEWLAAGPSASGHAGGYRWKNVPRLSDWMASVERTGGWSGVVDLEPPHAGRALLERIMLGLRVADGLDENSLFAEAKRLGCADGLERRIAAMTDLGRLTRAEGRVRLTETGFLFADGVAGALMDAVPIEPS
jgi:oxygen-independent coproporphyrinogen-3 oxidase